MNAADHDPAEKIAVIQGGHLQLQGFLWIPNRRWNVAQDGIKERLHGVALGFHVGLGITAHATTKEVGKIALIVVSAKFKK